MPAPYTASSSPAVTTSPRAAARVSTAPSTGPAQNPATPLEAPRSTVLTSPARVAACDCSMSLPGSARERSNPKPRIWTTPSTIMMSEAAPMISVRWVTKTLPSAPAPIPRGTSTTSSPR